MLSHCSCVWLFVTPWTVAHQAPLSMGFSRQESWNGLPCSPPGDLHNSGTGWVFYISCISRWVLYYQDLWTSTIQTGKPRAFSYGASLASEGKNPPAVQEMQEALVWSLGGGRSPGGKHGNPLQYSCLENPMADEPDRLQSMESQRVGYDWRDLACTSLLLNCVLLFCYRR